MQEDKLRTALTVWRDKLAGTIAAMTEQLTACDAMLALLSPAGPEPPGDAAAPPAIDPAPAPPPIRPGCSSRGGAGRARARRSADPRLQTAHRG